MLMFFCKFAMSFILIMYMKKRVLLVSTVVAALGLFSACQQKPAGVPTSVAEVVAPSADLSTIKVDSIVMDTTWALKDKDLIEYIGDDVNPGLNCVIDVPSVEQSPILANAVMEWVNERCLGGYFDGDVTDVKAMLRAYIKQSCSEEFGYGMGSDTQFQFEIRKVYENNNLITFVCTGDDYAFGAAHGMPYLYGATFRKSDGKRFGWNMFRGNAELQPALKSGLMKYFDASTNEELAENLMVDELYSPDYLPKPVTDPWITKDGVEMVYQSYEIACFAAGQPSVTISAKEAEKLLTPTMAKLMK